MRLLIGTAIVFFGTLMAAGLFALGSPVVVDFVAAHQRLTRSAAPHTRVSMDVQTAPRAGEAHVRR